MCVSAGRRFLLLCPETGSGKLARAQRAHPVRSSVGT